jgi:hypothetical protein
MVTDSSIWVDDQRNRCDTFGMSKIPVHREEITEIWLADQLSGSGKCEIASLKHEELTGHNPGLSQLFRTHIRYASRTPAQPDIVIVKIPPVDARNRAREAAFGPYASELGAYRLLESFQGREIARMYSAVEDPIEQTACFIFEDLGSLPHGQKYALIDLDIARSAVEFMGAYHARFWNDDKLAENSWIRGNDWANLFNADPREAAVGWQAIRYDSRFEKSDGLIAAGDYLGERLIDLQVAMRNRPNTLTHNDFHQGNILLRETEVGQRPVIIDWQLTACAGGTNDLAKFLMTAVPFELLAESERSLVEHYSDCLWAQGVRDYSIDECWRDYRRAQVMVFGNYAIAGVERSADGSVAHSSGDSTHAVIRALALLDPAELSEFLP